MPFESAFQKYSSSSGTGGDGERKYDRSREVLSYLFEMDGLYRCRLTCRSLWNNFLVKVSIWRNRGGDYNNIVDLRDVILRNSPRYGPLRAFGSQPQSGSQYETLTRSRRDLVRRANSKGLATLGLFIPEDTFSASGCIMSRFRYYNDHPLSNSLRLLFSTFVILGWILFICHIVLT